MESQGTANKLSVFFDSFRHDLILSLRAIQRRPGFCLSVILSLALGIGANTAIFSLLDGLLFRPLPVHNAGEIVTVDAAASSDSRFGNSSYMDYADLAAQVRSCSGLSLFRHVAVSLKRGEQQGKPELVWTLLVSGNYFDVLGVKPIIGRSFQPEEDRRPDAFPVAVISYRLWRERFDGSNSISGKKIMLNEYPFTIIGVAPQSFTGTEQVYRPEVYVPTMMSAKVVQNGAGLLQSRSRRGFEMFGRLSPGFTAEQAQAEFDGLGANLSRQFPDSNKSTRLIVRKEMDRRMDREGTVFPFLMAGLVALVLLIACGNVANLLIANSTARVKEIATQFALGATRMRLVRQDLTQSSLLALAGAILGTVLGVAAIKGFAALAPYSATSQTPEFRLDLRALGYTTLVSAAAILLCGLGPAFAATGKATASALRTRGAGSGAGVFGMFVRRALVTGQVGISVLLMIAAGLFLKSFLKAQEADLGFDPRNVLLVRLDPGLSNYPTARAMAFYENVSHRIAALLDVKAVSVGVIVPFVGKESWDIAVDGYTSPGGDQYLDITTNSVGPRYFETMGIPILAGREFTENDTAATSRVAVVNEAFARRYIIASQDIEKALGRIIRLRDGVPIQIAGVARNSSYGQIGHDAVPAFFLPHRQRRQMGATLHVRTGGNPVASVAAVRAEINRFDPDLTPVSIVTLQEAVSSSGLFVPRVTAVFSGAFGLVALALAIIGLYGVVSFMVQKRTQEFGIRMALGAQPGTILKLVFSNSLILVLTGTALGVGGAAILAPLLRSLLVGVNPWDVAAFTILPSILVVVAIAASWGPAHRATRIDPAIALRSE